MPEILFGKNNRSSSRLHGDIYTEKMIKTVPNRFKNITSDLN